MTSLAAFNIFTAAAESPGAPGLVHALGTLSYRDLAGRSALAIHWLERRLGPFNGWLGSAAPVAVLADPCVDQIAMTYALIALGHPILPLHPRLTQPERERLLEETQASLLVTREWSEAAQLLPRGPSELSVDPEQTLALVQTSGSSGSPRLACLSHRAFRASAKGSARRLGWRQRDRWALALPFAHVGGLSILTRSLAARRAVVLVEPAQRSKTEQLADAILNHGVTLLSLVPTQLRRLLQTHAFRPPPHLRLTLLGGAPAPADLVQQAYARGVIVLPSYGLTEACSQVCTVSPPTGAATLSEAGVGRPLAGVEIRLHEGTIEVRGATLFSGYWSGPVHGPDTWFPTGDLGHFDGDGCLHVSGRTNELIITGGENVHPAEVEAALESAVGQRRICVFGSADETWGQLVTMAIEGPPDEQLVLRIADVAQQRLADFRRPRRVAFLEKFPELPSGKVARRAVARGCSSRLQRLEHRP